jgi:hypothetical protein
MSQSDDEIDLSGISKLVRHVHGRHPTTGELLFRVRRYKTAKMGFGHPTTYVWAYDTDLTRQGTLADLSAWGYTGLPLEERELGFFDDARDWKYVLPVAEKFDWRPDEAIPEDFYAG